ncbi:MAG: hypothetical protein V2A62_03305 [Candidatus Woesearchaeota archaeon]
MDKIVSEIKQKKELRSINDAVVLEQLQKYLTQHPRLKLENPRSFEYRQMIKDVRAKLRRSYGLFREEKVEVRDFKEVKSILESHSSTRERLPFYSELYCKIFKITGFPQTILDLGCGINPFSYSFMHLKGVEYYAYDINEKEVELINRFFTEKKISGKAQVLDVFKANLVQKMSAADVAFMFKITDILDQGKGHKKTEEIMLAVPARYVVVSFPTLTMSGKPMNAPRRKWMEWLCQRLGLEYKILEFENEIFYVVRK